MAVRDLPGNRGYRGFQTTGAALDSFLNLSYNNTCVGAPTAIPPP